MQVLITFSILWTVSFSIPGVEETMIRYQSSGIVGRTETSNTLTIDSVPIAWSDRRNNGFLSVNTECEAPFRMTLKIITKSFNHTNPNNHTFQRTRECLLEVFTVLQVSDRIYYDGAEYLILDSATNTWTAAVPQALELKQQWDRDGGRTARHKTHLQNGCTELVKEFSHDNNSAPEASVANILILILVIVVVLCQFMFSVFISMRGSKQVGGVLGSIIHYPERSITPSKGNPEENDPMFTSSKSMKTSLLVVPV